MLIRREETWGQLVYDTREHRFFCISNLRPKKVPYITKPIVLNCDLTFECNMDCLYCVAKDMKDFTYDDLVVGKKLITNINKSDFMVIVITGGEPLLDEYAPKLLELIDGLEEKGIIVDTNGTAMPNPTLLKSLKRKNVLLRISFDSPRPQDEWNVRIAKGGKSTTQKLYEKKLSVIQDLRAKGLKVAIQSVLHGKNLVSILDMPKLLSKWSIKQWYVQRFIPSYKLKDDSRFSLEIHEYERVIHRLEAKAAEDGIFCLTKKDRRHNSVFLLVGDGKIFTQGDRPGEKVFIGELGDIVNHFELVSSSEHSMRYYTYK